MILPRLYDAWETDFSNNGIGTLFDAIECKVTQTQGSSLLEMKYPVSGRLFEELQSMRIILAPPEPDAKPQPYSIYKMKKTSAGIVTVYARHVCYNLDGWAVAPFSSSSLGTALTELVKNRIASEAYSDNSLQSQKYSFKFMFETTEEMGGSFSLENPSDIWSVIGKKSGSLIETFGAEVEFDGYTVRFVKRRGQNGSASVRYGKNLISLEQEENFAKCYSGIVAFYKPDSNYRFAPVNAPGKHPISRSLLVDMSDASWAVENYTDLVEKARKYISDKNVGQPEVSLTVKISSLRNSKDYEDVKQLEAIGFGDTVHVYFPKLDITSSARVSKTVYDCLQGCYDSIDIGSEKKGAADVIENQQRQINNLKK